MKRFILLTLVAFVLFSCSKRESDQQPILGGCGTAISISDIAFTPMADNYEFAISSVSPYLIKGIPAWATLKLYDSALNQYKKANVRELEDGTFEYYSAVGTTNYLIEVGYNRARRPDSFTPGDTRDALLTIESEDASIMESIKLTQEYPYLIIKAQGIDSEKNVPTAEVEIEKSGTTPRNFTWNYTEITPFESSAIKFIIECNTDLIIDYEENEKNKLANSITASLLSGIYSSVRTDGKFVHDGWLVGPEATTHPQNKEYHFEWEFIPETYNISDSNRETKVTINNPENLDKYVIAFSQNHVRFITRDTQNEVSKSLSYASCYTSPQTIKVDSEIEWDIEVESGKNWVVLDPVKPSGTGTGQFSVNINHADCKEGANAVSEESKAIVTVWGYVKKNSSDPKRIPIEIEILQAPYIFKALDSEGADMSELNLSNTKATSNTVCIQSSGDWKISSADEWTALSTLSGKGSQGNEYISDEFVVISTNDYNYDTKSERKTVVTAESTLNTMKREIAITQPKYTFESEAKETTLSTFDVEEHEISINSTGAWRLDVSYEGSANGGEPWLSFSATKGTGAEGGEANTIVKYRANTGNGHADDRKAHITVVSEPHEAKNMANGVNIGHSITQSKYTFEVSMDNLSPEFKAIPITTQYRLDIKCSAAWIVEAPEWIQVQRSGEGDAKLTVKADYNYSYEPREGYIVVKSIYEPTGTTHTSDSYHVKQLGFVLNVEPQEYVSVPAFIRKESYDINVLSSTRWSVVKDYDFNNYVAKVSAESGEADVQATTKVTAKSNPDLSPREFSVSIAANQEHGLVKSVLFKQEAYEFDSTPIEKAYESLNNETLIVDVLCSGDWVLVNRPEWLKVQDYSGDGIYNGDNTGSGHCTLKIKVENNYNLADRQTNGFVLKSTLNELERPISASQKAFKFDTEGVELSSFGSISDLDRDFTIGEVDGAWRVQSKPSWLTSFPTQGNGNQQVILQASENVEKASRSGELVLASEYVGYNNQLVKRVKVSQLGLIYDDEPVTIEEFGYFPAGSKELTIGECQGGWKLTYKPSWISVVESGNGNESIQLTAEKNYSLEGRSGLVKLTSNKNPNLVKVVTVSQSAFLFDTSPVLVECGSITDLSYIMQIGAIEGSWRVDEGVSWLIVSPQNGGGNANVSLQAQENLEKTPREFILQFKSEYIEHNPALVKNVLVKQAGFVYDDAAVVVDQFAALPTGSKSVNIGQCDGGWSLLSKPSWISMKESGDGNETIQLTATANYELEPRSGEIKLVSKKNSKYVKTITVSQAAFAFDTNSESVTQFSSIGAVYNRNIGKYDGAIRVVSQPDWASVQITGTQLSITTQTNTSLDTPRSGTIRLESEYISQNSKLYKEIAISQATFKFDTAKTTVEEFASVGGTNSMTIGSYDGTITVASKPSWIETVRVVGQTVSITVTPNTSLDTPRSGTIRLESEYISQNSKLYKEIAVSQAAFKFDTASDSKSFGAVTTLSQTVTLGEIDGTWSVSAPQWITVTPSTGSGSMTITLKAAENVNKAARSDEVVISSQFVANNAQLVKRISVAQSGIEFDETQVVIDEFASVPTAAKSFTIGKCDGGWTVQSIPSWISANVTSGNGGEAIQLTAKANYDLTPRNDAIVIVSKKNSKLVKKVVVSQAAFKFDTNSAKLTYGVAGGSQEVKLGACDGAWSVQNSSAWITVSPTQGKGAATLTISVAQNDTAQPRSATIQVVSSNNSKLVKTITIEQSVN